MLDNTVEFLPSTYRPGVDVVQLDLGPRWLTPPAFIAHGPRAAEEVLSAKASTSFTKEGQRFYRQIRLGVGDGILTATGEEWLRQKRFVQPMFTRKRVEGYTDRMIEGVEDLLERWRDGGTVDLGEGLSHLTLRVVTQVLFGGESEVFEETVRGQFAALNRSVLTRAGLPFPVPLGLPFRFNRELRAAQAALHDVSGELIDQRRRAGASGDDLASLLIAARDGDEHLSDEEIRDQVLVFLLAGHETTSTSLTFALHLLGWHPEVQDRLRAEVAEVLSGRRPTAAELASSLPYTTAVLKESMRLFPAAPFIGRLSVEACTLQGYDVPAGSDVVVSIWSLHRREDLWPDPLAFRPERFLGEQHRDRYAWMPFGAGPRACLGQHFSMLESVAVLAMLVRAFEFRAPAGAPEHPRVASGITLFSTEPVRSELSPL